MAQMGAVALRSSVFLETAKKRVRQPADQIPGIGMTNFGYFLKPKIPKNSLSTTMQGIDLYTMFFAG